MQKYNNIKALLFLGIFSILLMHQVLPHWHHEHDVEHSHKAVAISHAHSHHHDVPEKESPKKGFLDLFLEMHVDSVVTNEIRLTHESSIEQLEVKKDINTPASLVRYYSFINYDEANKSKVYHPPNNYYNAYLSHLDSRGPPSLC